MITWLAVMMILCIHAHYSQFISTTGAKQLVFGCILMDVNDLVVWWIVRCVICVLAKASPYNIEGAPSNYYEDPNHYGDHAEPQCSTGVSACSLIVSFSPGWVHLHTRTHTHTPQIRHTHNTHNHLLCRRWQAILCTNEWIFCVTF